MDHDSPSDYQSPDDQHTPPDPREENEYGAPLPPHHTPPHHFEHPHTFHDQEFTPPPPQPHVSNQTSAHETSAYGFQSTQASVNQTVIPQPVVKVLSPRGVEYVFMTIALVTGAVGLTSALLALVNGNDSFSVLYFPLALLLVSVPIFSGLFLRLKQAELLDPNARLDASKRRSTQFLQIVSFFICFFTLIGLLATIFAKVSGTYNGSLVKVILDVIVILAVAGGILFYYWNDEHKNN